MSGTRALDRSTLAGAILGIASGLAEAQSGFQEAAKLVKYGGFTEEQALTTITLNPAIQLGIDKRVGSIEVSKDADLAIFNGHPLNAYSRCELTLVEGEVFFQRAEKLTAFDVAKDGPAKPVANRKRL